MYIYQFNKETGRVITKFDSNFIMSRILKLSGQSYIGCAHLEREGIIGYHQAPTPQLFLIVNGDGRIRGSDNIDYYITQGDAVYWEKGEWHETRTDSGLTAIIIEGEEINSSTLQLISKEGSKSEIISERTQ
ncbi:cupin [Paenibacillus enshidis]|uniref:Cupin n=1 Tax=Paenibacillus enshidis TaxID=1458439 RepID=A0ABV5AZ76_9BACL